MSSIDAAIAQCGLEQNPNRWIPPGVKGSGTTNALDRYINDVITLIATAQQDCNTESLNPSCINVTNMVGCTVDVEDFQQVCVVSLDSQCVSQASYIADTAFQEALEAATASAAANVEAFDQSAWTAALYSLQYLITINISQLCAATALGYNSFNCTGSTIQAGLISQCIYMDAQLNCLQTTPGYPEAYQAALYALQGSYPTSRGADATSGEKEAVAIAMVVAALVIILAVAAVLLSGSGGARGRWMAEKRAGVWLLVVGACFCVLGIPGIVWLYWPYVDIFGDATISPWQISLAEVTQTNRVNVAILGIFMLAASLCLGVGAGVVTGDALASVVIEDTKMSKTVVPNIIVVTSTHGGGI